MYRREAIFKALLRNSGSVALFDLAPSRLNGAGEGSNWKQQGQRQAGAQERVTLLRPAARRGRILQMTVSSGVRGVMR
jgi:hypothetical protein